MEATADTKSTLGVPNSGNPGAQEAIPLWLYLATEPVIWLFRALHTVKFGLVLLGILTVVSIIGSIISANGDLGPEFAKQLIFNTWWFLALMGLLCVNLVLATFDRSVTALSLYKKASFREAPAFYEKSSHGAAIPFAGNPDEIEAELRRHYTVVRRKGNSFYAQRGLLSRTGFTIIHIGLIATMAAGFYRILADEFRVGIFDGTIIMPEGLTTNNYFTRKDRLQKPTGSNLEMHNLPFHLRLLDFHVENHPGSTVARKYSSLIELTDPDTGFSKIAEVTMETPILYNGYKITQNSYSETDKVKRGRFLVTDRDTGRTFDLDASVNDPVMLDPVRHSNGLFLQVNALAPSGEFAILDLANQQVVARGTIESPRAAGPIPLDLTAHASLLAESKYSFLVAALFPHFSIDASGQPTTLSEEFVNPAVLIMVFKNGRPNGYLWLFLSEEAARIMGQPHPEIAARFEAWRIKNGRDGSQGLVDYEVNLSFVDKSTSRSIGAIWASPGKVTELTGIDPQVLSLPNVTADDVSLRRRGGSGMTAQAVGGSSEPTATLSGSSPGAGNDRFQVVFLGTVNGHVSYLGFMKDPSVFWIYLGCMVIVGGTLIAWLITYREAWFHYNPDRRVLYLATQIRGKGRRAHRQFDALIDRLSGIGSARAN